MVYEGLGLGLLEGKPIFVPYVLPGEKVKVRITRWHKQYLHADLIEVIEPAPERIEPPCPYFGGPALRSPKGEAGCGGCQWQHMTYETQLLWKQKILEETLARIGKIENPNILPTIPSPKQFGWRSRVTLHQDENGKIGFFEEGTKRVVDIEECLIVEEEINRKLRELRTENREQRAESRKPKVENREPKTENRKWKTDYELRSIEEKGFTQVNPLQNETLKKLVKEWVQKVPHDHIVELFCGSGNFTEVLIPIAKKITAVDSDREAITSTHQHTNTSAQFFCTDALRFWSQYQSAEPVDLLVLDPPRDGAAGIVEGVIKHRPKNILYISCNPTTLARDLKFLKDFAGYNLVQSQPIDMFPMSYHIESVNWIARGEQVGEGVQNACPA